MSLADEYKRQFLWRDWGKVIDALPSLSGKRVLDLGCGVGDLAAELVKRGAHVVGIDANDELIREARSRNLADAEFHLGDLRQALNLVAQFDGIWSSFTAAYFPDFDAALERWSKNLKPGGWIALTEIDDLFGHSPLKPETQSLFNAFYDEALATGRYDFRMGRKLEEYLRRTGFDVPRVLLLEDRELSFSGRAAPEVLEAWRNRFARMPRLRNFCGQQSAQVEEEFIGCLSRDDHRSRAKVYACIADARTIRSGSRD